MTAIACLVASQQVIGPKLADARVTIDTSNCFINLRKSPFGACWILVCWHEHLQISAFRSAYSIKRTIQRFTENPKQSQDSIICLALESNNEPRLTWLIRDSELQYTVNDDSHLVPPTLLYHHSLVCQTAAWSRARRMSVERMSCLLRLLYQKPQVLGARKGSFICKYLSMSKCQNKHNEILERESDIYCLQSTVKLVNLLLVTLLSATHKSASGS
ncbi:hypothetical protein KCV00_g131, partial [Aureobasidium melanogenum]